MGLVVAFSGRIGSGKSSVAVALADELGWPRAGFGDYLRSEIARRGGDPDSRQALQDYGQSLVEDDPEAFCAAVMASAGFLPGGNLLLDGIRHVAIYRIVQRLVSPSTSRLIYLAADEAVRVERVLTRGRADEDLARAEQHQVEAELVEALPAAADQVLSAQAQLNDLVNACRGLIEEWRPGS